MNTRLIGLVVSALLLAACDNRDGEPANQAPTIAAIADQVISANISSDSITVVIDDETPDTVTLAVASDNDRLLPASMIDVGGAGATRSVVLTPTSDELGSAVVSITATDGNGRASTTRFAVDVVAQQVSLLTFTRDTFAADENSEPVLINAIEFVQDTGNDDFADLLQ